MRNVVQKKNLKILIVDDVSLNRKILRDMLDSDYEILEAVDGNQAVLCLQQYYSGIALILLDIIMPRYDGFVVLEEMNRQGWIENIPVIAISADDSPEYVERAYNLGVTDYIARHTDPLIIKKRIENTISMSMKQRQMQYTDVLTGVLNLTGFRHGAMDILKENPNGRFAVWYADIKNFKFINNNYGYEEGNKLLKRICVQLEQYMRDGDLVCRTIGDCMAGLIRLDQHEAARDIFPKVLQETRNYYAKLNRDFQIDIYVGIYLLAPNDAQVADIDQMIGCARVAQQSIKRMSGGGLAFYNEGQWKNLQRSIEIGGRLEAAFESGEISVWYQPQVNYVTGELVGAEALCRWNHKKLGPISPVEFIAVLEESGQISKLDTYVWDTACKNMSEWLEEGYKVPISVNISRKDILDTDLGDHFMSLLDKYNLTPDMLRLEITESAYIDEADKLIESVAKLREYGFVVEMDDFGSGYSSLNVLKDVPVDIVKLDLRFLTESENSIKGGNIISYIIRMIHSLDMRVLAEGVETEAQADFLKSMNCRMMQGYYFAKPMCKMDFEEYVFRSKISKILPYKNEENKYNIQEILDKNSNSSFIFNRCIGGGALISVSEERLEVLMSNEALYECIGGTRDEFMVNFENVYSILEPTVRAALEEALQNAVEKGEERFEVYVKATNRWISCTFRYLYQNGNEYVMFCQAKNSTREHILENELANVTEEKKRAQMEQKWQNQKLQLLLNAPGMVTYDYDPATDQMKLCFNTDEGEYKERVAEQFLEKIYERNYIAPESIPDFETAMRAATKEATTQTVLVKALFRDGLYYLCRYIFASVADENGKVYRVVGRAERLE